MFCWFKYPSNFFWMYLVYNKLNNHNFKENRSIRNNTIACSWTVETDTNITMYVVPRTYLFKTLRKISTWSVKILRKSWINVSLILLVIGKSWTQIWTQQDLKCKLEKSFLQSQKYILTNIKPVFQYISSYLFFISITCCHSNRLLIHARVFV